MKIWLCCFIHLLWGLINGYLSFPAVTYYAIKGIFLTRKYVMKWLHRVTPWPLLSGYSTYIGIPFLIPLQNLTLAPLLQNVIIWSISPLSSSFHYLRPTGQVTYCLTWTWFHWISMLILVEPRLSLFWSACFFTIS